MAAVTICRDFGAQKIKSTTVSTVSPSICHEVDLQYCANFCCTTKWFSYTYIFLIFFSIIVYYRILNIVPHSTCFNMLVSLVAQSCPTLCNPMDCSPPGPSVHGILQARILERVAIPSSKGSSLPRDQTQVSCSAGWFFTIWATRDLFFAEFPNWLS